MEVIKMSVVILAVFSCLLAFTNLALISLELPRIYMRVTIGIYYVCTFVVLFHVIFLMKKAFMGSRYSWKLSAHILLYLLTFLISLTAVFGSDHQLKFPVTMVVLTLVLFVMLSCYNGLLFIIFSRNEEKFQEELAERLTKSVSQHGRLSRSPRSHLCYMIALYDDDYDRHAAGSSLDLPRTSSIFAPKVSKSVMFAEIVELKAPEDEETAAESETEDDSAGTSSR